MPRKRVPLSGFEKWALGDDDAPTMAQKPGVDPGGLAAFVADQLGLKIPKRGRDEQRVWRQVGRIRLHVEREGNKGMTLAYAMLWAFLYSWSEMPTRRGTPPRLRRRPTDRTGFPVFRIRGKAIAVDVLLGPGRPTKQLLHMILESVEDTLRKKMREQKPQLEQPHKLLTAVLWMLGKDFVEAIGATTFAELGKKLERLTESPYDAARSNKPD